jgi:hypothetical protein
MEPYFTVEPSDHDGFWVVRHDEWPASSVLAGQDRRSLLQHFDTIEEALDEFPEAEALEHSTKNAFAEVLPDVAPDWFDPLDAGESWDSDY